MPHVADRHVSESALHELLGARLTYAEVKATMGDMPSGYRHLERQIYAGTGLASFQAVSQLVMTWEMHRRSGLAVRPSHSPVVEGAVAILRLGLGPLGVRAPVRIVDVVDEQWRRGFAYGTLPGHPETGEELFLVQHHSDDQVTLTVKAFSRPASRLARVGGPLARAVQNWVIRRYLVSAYVLGLKHSNLPRRHWIFDRFDHRTVALVQAPIALIAATAAILNLHSGDTFMAAWVGVCGAVAILTGVYFLFRSRRLRADPPN